MSGVKKTSSERCGSLIKYIIIVFALFVLSVILFLFVVIVFPGIKMRNTKPKSTDLLQEIKEKYNRDFSFIKEYPHTESYGDDGKTKIENCPTIEVEDTVTHIKFEVRARWEAEIWSIYDDFDQKSLIFCLEENNISYQLKNYIPCLFLNNSREDAEKLQKTVIQFNKIYTVDPDKTLDDSADFQVPDSLYLYSIYAGYQKDTFIERTDPFFFDTPIEKYEMFLNSVCN